MGRCGSQCAGYAVCVRSSKPCATTACFSHTQLIDLCPTNTTEGHTCDRIACHPVLARQRRHQSIPVWGARWTDDSKTAIAHLAQRLELPPHKPHTHAHTYTHRYGNNQPTNKAQRQNTHLEHIWNITVYWTLKHDLYWDYTDTRIGQAATLPDHMRYPGAVSEDREPISAKTAPKGPTNRPQRPCPSQARTSANNGAIVRFSRY